MFHHTLFAFICLFFIFQFSLQPDLAVAQRKWESDIDREAQKWPQNYPGGGIFRHYPWERSPNNVDIDDSQWNDANWPPYYTGHIGQSRKGNQPRESEDTYDRWRYGDHRPKEYENRRDDQKRRHDHEREGEDGDQKPRSWFDRLLDWIFPWRKHGQRRSHDEEEDGWRHRHTRPYKHHSSTTMPPPWTESEEQKQEEMRRRHWKKNETILVRLDGGSVLGLVSYAAGKDKPAHVFRGIPFAEPPLGELRFAPLRRKKPWRTPVDATKYRAACLSNTTRTRSPQHYISEDCIYMNVFADPKCKKSRTKSSGGCPVLFYVHGGGFAYDSATMFNDTQIVQKYASDGVIFLIPAYRLGVFGFLDLGNDRTVQRNLGMHDIIFALDWTRREIGAFGGDPDRITIMGNSAGASAVNYLCASPAVKEGQFQQAIISSGVPFFREKANLEQSFALLHHFNCLHDNTTNRTLPDRFKVECLREVDSLELLREQQRNEERGIVFAGPERDEEILPAENYVELLKFWKPRPLLYSTTTHEFGRFRWMAEDNKLPRECLKALVPFGYTSPQSFNHCMARYNETFDVDVHMRVTYESMHAEAFLTSLVNTRLGGISFVGEFELANYSNHADDMYFFFGLHPVPLDQVDVKLMDMYYPRMIKNFLHGHAPDPNWNPQSWNGRNYFRIAFNVSGNGTLMEWPHEVDGYQDVPGLDFWLRQMAITERNARMEAMNETATGWNKTHWADDAKTWQEVFGNRHNNNSPGNGIRETRPYHILLPAVRSFLQMPTNLEGANPNENGTRADVSTGQGAVAPGPPSIGSGFLQIPPSVESNMAGGNTAPSSFPFERETAGNELVRVWSAYWLTLTVAVMLALGFVMMAATKMIYRYKNARGYHPTGSDMPVSNGQVFTEKTHIIHPNGNNSLRYV